MTASVDASPVSSFCVPAPFGSLVIRGNACGLLAIDLSLESCAAPADGELTPLLRQAAHQFQAYFRDGSFEFSLPLLLRGSPYQRRVWAALLTVGAGKTISYGDLAQQMASGPRAVAAACRANSLPLVIPCHRVVASNGLGGYCGETAGAMLDVKRWLLQHERSSFAG